MVALAVMMVVAEVVKADVMDVTVVVMDVMVVVVVAVTASSAMVCFCACMSLQISARDAVSHRLSFSLFAARNPPTRTDFRVRVSDLPRGTDWRNVKDFLRTGGEVTYCNIESDGTACVTTAFKLLLVVLTRWTNCCCLSSSLYDLVLRNSNPRTIWTTLLRSWTTRSSVATTFASLRKAPVRVRDARALARRRVAVLLVARAPAPQLSARTRHVARALDRRPQRLRTRHLLARTLCKVMLGVLLSVAKTCRHLEKTRYFALLFEYSPHWRTCSFPK